MTSVALASEDYDYITSIAMANTFFATGVELLQMKKPSTIFAGATNIGLSLELYLKSLIVMEGNNKPNIHTLDKLYLLLSDNLKTEIEKKYRNLGGGNHNNEAFFIRGKKENSNNQNNSNSPYIKSENLITLLEQHKNIFTTFRYMSEKARSNEWKHFILEYENISILSDVLKDIIYRLLSDEQIEKIIYV